jgi:hypothetical protein
MKKLASRRLGLVHRRPHVFEDRCFEKLGDLLKGAALHSQIEIETKSLPLLISTARDAV